MKNSTCLLRSLEKTLFSSLFRTIGVDKICKYDTDYNSQLFNFQIHASSAKNIKMHERNEAKIDAARVHYKFDRQNYVVLCDAGAASALQWHVFNIEALDSSSCSSCSASCSSPMFHEQILNIEAMRTLQARCINLANWENMLFSLKQKEEIKLPSHITIIITDFLWNYQKEISNLIARFMEAVSNTKILQRFSSKSQASERIAETSNAVRIHVLSALTEAAHNCHPAVNVCGKMIFSDFGSELKRTARQHVTSRKVLNTVPYADFPVSVLIEHISMPSVPVTNFVSRQHYQTASTNEANTYENDAKSVQLLLSAWPRVMTVAPILQCQIENDIIPKSATAVKTNVLIHDSSKKISKSETQRKSVEVADHQTTPMSCQESNLTPIKASADTAYAQSNFYSSRGTPTTQSLPMSALRSLGLVAHNITSSIKALNIKIDGEHVWASSSARYSTIYDLFPETPEYGTIQ